MFKLNDNPAKWPLEHRVHQYGRNEYLPLQQPVRDNQTNEKSMEERDYVQWQEQLQKRSISLRQNSEIWQEKSRLKDKQIQMAVQILQQASSQIQRLEGRLKGKEGELEQVGKRCHELKEEVGRQKQAVHREALVLKEETEFCSVMEGRASSLSAEIEAAEGDLERKRRAAGSLPEQEEHNMELREYMRQMEDEDRVMQMRATSQEHECKSLQEKLGQLKQVANQKAKVNRNNAAKVKAQAKEIGGLGNSRRGDRGEQLRAAQMQLGDLNQQLLLANEEIAQQHYKISKKKQMIEEMHSRLQAHRQLQSVLPSSPTPPALSEEDQPSISPPRSHSPSPSPSPRRRSSHTPSFPSRQWTQQESQPVQAQSRQAQQNIQQLINRFEQIKSRDKHK